MNRKVKFRRWIPSRYDMRGGSKVLKDGTGIFEEEFNGRGTFLQWANCFEQFEEDGIGNYTVALVELKNGKIEEVLPQNLMFENKYYIIVKQRAN